MKRQVWEWLLLVLYIECVGLLMFRNWHKERLMLIDATNLVSVSPPPDWWAMIINISILCVGLGVALWWFKRYGVLAGLSIFLLGLLAAEQR